MPASLTWLYMAPFPELPAPATACSYCRSWSSTGKRYGTELMLFILASLCATMTAAG